MKKDSKARTISQRGKDKPAMTVGLDLGDRWSHYHYLNQDGEMVEEGKIRTSKEALSDLIKKIHADGETHTIRIFTIAYGSDAQKSVLEQIAAATQGKAYEGTPGNIVEVFRDISTFF